MFYVITFYDIRNLRLREDAFLDGFPYCPKLKNTQLPPSAKFQAPNCVYHGDLVSDSIN